MPQGKVLITGAAGLLGGALIEAAPAGVAVLAQTRRLALPANLRAKAVAEERLDLLDEASLGDCFQRHAPAGVIHAAARTSAAACEDDPEGARRDNVEASARLARLCAQARILLVQISTDLVFDGRHAPYREDAPTAPLGVYGRTKAQAEELALGCERGLVLRLPLLLGPSPVGRRSPDEQLAQAARRCAQVTLFHDEYRSPIHALAAARLIWELLALAEGSAPREGRTRGVGGLIHVAGRDRVSRWELGLAIAQRLGLDTAFLRSASLKEFTGRPPRPPDLTLDTSRLAALLGRPAPTLAESLALPLGQAGEAG
jgi:dTDP-4-dehydrorhamnose reductase